MQKKEKMKMKKKNRKVIKKKGKRETPLLLDWDASAKCMAQPNTPPITLLLCSQRRGGRRAAARAAMATCQTSRAFPPSPSMDNVPRPPVKP